MINPSEHLYDDDPQRGHPDVRTRLEDVSYFFLGNGLLQAAVQWAPRGDGTPLGLLIMDPERLRKKRDALTFDPQLGLSPTMVRLQAGGRDEQPEAGSVRVSWAVRSGVPAVEATWPWHGGEVREVFFCPDTTTPRLARDIVVTAAPGGTTPIRLRSACGGRPIEAALPGSGGRACLVYTLGRERDRVHVSAGPPVDVAENARRRWSERAQLCFSDPLLEHLGRVSRYQLGAALSANGRMDAGIWQYNREWVRDQALVAVGFLVAGDRQGAACILRRLLREFVTDEGGTVDSSEVRGADEAELDQNGALLHALERYVRWTGDRSLIEDNWSRIEAVAEYPLRQEFAHAPSGLLFNSREFWERHRYHGVQPGLELAHQVLVSIGLSAAASLARLARQPERERRWTDAARRLRDATLAHPTCALVSNGALVKRKGLDGTVQDHIEPMPGSLMPPQAPLLRPGPHLLNPDTCTVLPIAMRFIAADSPLAARTLDAVEPLWNQAWPDGGYGRYNTTSEPDSPGGWPFASLFIARSAVELGRPDLMWRVLRWLNGVAGAPAGSWFEFYGERVSPPFPQVGVVPWTWAELLALLVDHILGIRPEEEAVRVRPRLPPGLDQARARLQIGGTWVQLEVTRDPQLASPVARVRSEGGPTVEARTDELLLQMVPGHITVEILLPGA